MDVVFSLPITIPNALQFVLSAFHTNPSPCGQIHELYRYTLIRRGGGGSHLRVPWESQVELSAFAGGHQFGSPSLADDIRWGARRQHRIGERYSRRDVRIHCTLSWGELAVVKGSKRTRSTRQGTDGDTILWGRGMRAAYIQPQESQSLFSFSLHL